MKRLSISLLSAVMAIAGMSSCDTAKDEPSETGGTAAGKKSGSPRLPRAASGVIKDWPSDLNESDARAMFTEIAGRDLDKAKEMALQASTANAREGACLGIVSAWYRDDPVACYKWIMEQPGEARLRKRLVLHMLNGIWSEHGDPGRWFDIAKAGEFDDMARKQIRAAAARDTGRIHDIPSGLRFIGEKTGKVDRDLLRDFLEGRASKDPVAVAAYLNDPQNQDGTSVRSELAVKVAEAFNREGFDKGLDWALTLPPADSVRTMDYVIKQWLDLDAVAASNKIAEMPSGKPRDEAVAIMTRWLAEQGAAADAESWAKQIRDPELAREVADAIGKER